MLRRDVDTASEHERSHLISTETRFQSELDRARDACDAQVQHEQDTRDATIESQRMIWEMEQKQQRQQQQSHMDAVKRAKKEQEMREAHAQHVREAMERAMAELQQMQRVREKMEQHAESKRAEVSADATKDDAVWMVVVAC